MLLCRQGFGVQGEAIAPNITPVAHCSCNEDGLHEGGDGVELLLSLASGGEPKLA